MNIIAHDISMRAAIPEEETLCHTALFRQQAESISRWRQLVDGLKTVHVLQISRISDALINNQPLSEAVDSHESFAVDVFLNSPDADALKTVLSEKSRNDLKAEEHSASGNNDLIKIEMLFAQLHAANDQIMNAKSELETLWQVRHEGFEEKLCAIRRSYVNWSLQIANMLFVNKMDSLNRITRMLLEKSP